MSFEIDDDSGLPRLPYAYSRCLQALIADRLYPYDVEGIAYYQSGAGKLRLLAATHIGDLAADNPTADPQAWNDRAGLLLRRQGGWDGVSGMEGYLEGCSVADELARGVIDNCRQDLPPTMGFEWMGSENLVLHDELGLPYDSAAIELPPEET